VLAVLAFVIGYREETFRTLIRRVADVILGPGEAGTTAVVAFVPAALSLTTTGTDQVEGMVHLFNGSSDTYALGASALTIEPGDQGFTASLQSEDPLAGNEARGITIAWTPKAEGDRPTAVLTATLGGRTARVQLRGTSTKAPQGGPAVTVAPAAAPEPVAPPPVAPGDVRPAPIVPSPPDPVAPAPLAPVVAAPVVDPTLVAPVGPGVVGNGVPAGMTPAPPVPGDLEADPGIRVFVAGGADADPGLTVDDLTGFDAQTGFDHDAAFDDEIPPEHQATVGRDPTLGNGAAADGERD
jgi:hypothetical protein